MPRSYKVELSAGVHAWTVTDLDAPGYGLADPLTIGWSIPDGEHRPTQPDPMVAQFSVVVATAGDLDDLVLGDPVTIKVTFGPADKPAPDVSFYGRLAAGGSRPHTLGMLYTFTCADASVDWNGYDVGAAPYAVQSVGARFDAMTARTPLQQVNLIRDPTVAAVDPNLAVDQIEKPGALNLLAATLALWAQVGLNGLNELAGFVRYLAILAPYPGPGSTGMPFRYALDAVPDKYIPTALTPLPAAFGAWFAAPDAYGLKMSRDDRAAGVLDACYIERDDAEWAAIQPAAVNRSAVTWLTAANTLPDTTRVQQVTYTESGTPPGQTPTATTRETETIGYDAATTAAAQANAARLGAMMIPVPMNPGAWAPDTFRWLLYRDELGMVTFPVIFPRHDATNAPTPAVLRTAAYVRPIVVMGIPGKWNPADADRDWVAGQLADVELTIEGGRPVVDFRLLPTVPEPGNPDTAAKSWNARAGTWDAQAGQWDDQAPGRVAFRWHDPAMAGLTWNQLHPQPWNAYRLARGS